MTLQLDAFPQPGDTFTLSFSPTGIGNPFDSATDWYAAAAGLSYITVDNVNFSNGLFTTESVDVTVTYDGSTNASSYNDIGTALGNAAGGLGYGYTLLSASAGLTTGESGLPSSTTFPGLGSLTSSIAGGATHVVEWVVIAAVVVGFAFMFLRRETI